MVIGQQLRRDGRLTLLSRPVFGFTLLWVALVQVGEWAAAGEEFGALAARLVLACAVQVLMFAFPYATWRLVCPRVPLEYWNALLLAALLIGTVARGIAFGALLVVTGVSESPDFAFRIAASISHLAVVTVLLWFAVSEVRGLHALRHQLMSERSQLLASQQETQRELKHLGDRATVEIRAAILRSLGDLKAVGSAELLNRLRGTIDDVVRPLSHQLATQPSAWTPQQPLVANAGIDWPLAVRQGLTPARIHPVTLSIVLIWLGFPIHFFRFGAELTLAFVATMIVAIPAFWLARRVAIRLSAGRGTGSRTVAFVLAVVLGGLAPGLATVLYMQDQPQPLVFVVAYPLLALLIAGPWAIAEAARDQELEIDADLQSATEDLRWTVARTRERYRQQEGGLARALHGRLQASLAAAFLRLDRAIAQGADGKVFLDGLQAEVLQAVHDLDSIDSDPDPLEKILSLTRSNWSDAVQLDVSIDPRAREALAGDPLCARSVNELIPELVFNSIRHAHATSIAIKLEVADHRTVCLGVHDNGSGQLNETRHGLGSALLDEVAIAWTRKRRGEVTETTCLLPVLAVASPQVIPQCPEHRSRGSSGVLRRPED